MNKKSTNRFTRSSALVYFLALFSGYLVYWLFTLSSSYGLVSLTSFIASVIHFGISSWLFLFFNKTGRTLAIVSGILLMVWPLQASIHSLIDHEYSMLPYYLVPVLLTLLLVLIHR